MWRTPGIQIQYGVITQKIGDVCQFSWFCDDTPDKPADTDAWKRSKEIALALVLKKKKRVLSKAALWYNNPEKTAADLQTWFDTLPKGPKFGDHQFYTKPPIKIAAK